MSENPTNKPPTSWVDALDRAEADATAGRTHDFEEVMRGLKAEDAADLQPEPSAGRR